MCARLDLDAWAKAAVGLMMCMIMMEGIVWNGVVGKGMHSVRLCRLDFVDNAGALIGGYTFKREQ